VSTGHEVDGQYKPRRR